MMKKIKILITILLTFLLVGTQSGSAEMSSFHSFENVETKSFFPSSIIEHARTRLVPTHPLNENQCPAWIIYINQNIYPPALSLCSGTYTSSFGKYWIKNDATNSLYPTDTDAFIQLGAKDIPALESLHLSYDSQTITMEGSPAYGGIHLKQTPISGHFVGITSSKTPEGSGIFIEGSDAGTAIRINGHRTNDMMSIDHHGNVGIFQRPDSSQTCGSENCTLDINGDLNFRTGIYKNNVKKTFSALVEAGIADCTNGIGGLCDIALTKDYSLQPHCVITKQAGKAFDVYIEEFIDNGADDILRIQGTSLGGGQGTKIFYFCARDENDPVSN